MAIRRGTHHQHAPQGMTAGRVRDADFGAERPLKRPHSSGSMSFQMLSRYYKLTHYHVVPQRITGRRTTIPSVLVHAGNDKATAVRFVAMYDIL
jgi:hypothetical protein